MTIACFLAKLGLVSASLCAGPTPYDIGYIDADQELLNQVGNAVEMTNELIAAAGEPPRLVLRRMGAQVSDQAALSVFVVTPPGSAAMVHAGLERMGKTLDQFRLESFEMDPKYANCGDEDDCAEFLYRGQNITELVVDTFDGLANADVAREVEECKCIVLHAVDLRQYQAVFGRPWGAFIFGARYAGEPPPDMTKVPEIMKEPDGLDLRWILPTILLHEVGHTRPEVPLVMPKGPLEASVTDYFMQLGGGRKAEEARADAYAAAIMKHSCFLPGVSADAKRACLVSAYASMVVFGLTMWGKTKEALCARYFDPSVNYPNLHLRSLLRNALMTGSESSANLFADFLAMRTKLARKAGLQQVKRCADGLEATFVAGRGRSTAEAGAP
jgi:hypothetical protein